MSTMDGNGASSAYTAVAGASAGPSSLHQHNNNSNRPTTVTVDANRPSSIHNPDADFRITMAGGLSQQPGTTRPTESLTTNFRPTQGTQLDASIVNQSNNSVPITRAAAASPGEIAGVHGPRRIRGIEPVTIDGEWQIRSPGLTCA